MATEFERMPNLQVLDWMLERWPELERKVGW
jgi:hypothetical protein